MAARIDIKRIAREREFSKGCLVWIVRERNPNLSLDFLNVSNSDDSDEELSQYKQVDINQTLSNYKRIYEAINTYAVEHIEIIEAKYRKFFAYRSHEENHVKTFMELVSRYAHGLREKSFSYEIIIAFCAHLSVFGFMSYQAKELKEAIMYAISTIVYMLKFYDFDDSKYSELKLFAENSFQNLTDISFLE